MKRICAFFAALCACISIVSCSRAKAEMTVIFFNAGAADAILIQTENSAVLVDTGLKKNADALVAQLRNAGVTALDALIITHYDKDHVGGTPAVLAAFPTARVLEPDYVKDAKPYESYREALAQAGITPETLREDVSFTLDGAAYHVDAAARTYSGKNESNDMSLVARVTWGNTCFLLAGDVEKDRIDEMLADGVTPCDVLKVPHHGRIEDNSAAFFTAAAPRFAVITSDEEEPEDAEVLDLLRQTGAQALLTREGTVTCVSDGETVRAAQ